MKQLFNTLLYSFYIVVCCSLLTVYRSTLVDYQPDLSERVKKLIIPPVLFADNCSLSNHATQPADKTLFIQNAAERQSKAIFYSLHGMNLNFCSHVFHSKPQPGDGAEEAILSEDYNKRVPNSLVKILLEEEEIYMTLSRYEGYYMFQHLLTLFKACLVALILHVLSIVFPPFMDLYEGNFAFAFAAFLIALGTFKWQPPRFPDIPPRQIADNRDGPDSGSSLDDGNQGGRPSKDNTQRTTAIQESSGQGISTETRGHSSSSTTTTITGTGTGIGNTKPKAKATPGSETTSKAKATTTSVTSSEARTTTETAGPTMNTTNNETRSSTTAGPSNNASAASGPSSTPGIKPAFEAKPTKTTNTTASEGEAAPVTSTATDRRPTTEAKPTTQTATCGTTTIKGATSETEATVGTAATTKTTSTETGAATTGTKAESTANTETATNRTTAVTTPVNSGVNTTTETVTNTSSSDQTGDPSGNNCGESVENIIAASMCTDCGGGISQSARQEAQAGEQDDQSRNGVKDATTKYSNNDNLSGNDAQEVIEGQSTHSSQSSQFSQSGPSSNIGRSSRSKQSGATRKSKRTRKSNRSSPSSSSGKTGSCSLSDQVNVEKQKASQGANEQDQTEQGQADQVQTGTNQTSQAEQAPTQPGQSGDSGNEDAGDIELLDDTPLINQDAIGTHRVPGPNQPEQDPSSPHQTTWPELVVGDTAQLEEDAVDPKDNDNSSGTEMLDLMGSSRAEASGQTDGAGESTTNPEEHQTEDSKDKDNKSQVGSNKSSYKESSNGDDSQGHRSTSSGGFRDNSSNKEPAENAEEEERRKKQTEKVEREKAFRQEVEAGREEKRQRGIQEKERRREAKNQRKEYTRLPGGGQTQQQQRSKKTEKKRKKEADARIKAEEEAKKKAEEEAKNKAEEEATKKTEEKANSYSSSSSNSNFKDKDKGKGKASIIGLDKLDLEEHSYYQLDSEKSKLSSSATHKKDLPKFTWSKSSSSSESFHRANIRPLRRASATTAADTSGATFSTATGRKSSLLKPSSSSRGLGSQQDATSLMFQNILRRAGPSNKHLSASSRSLLSSTLIPPTVIFPSSSSSTDITPTVAPSHALQDDSSVAPIKVPRKAEKEEEEPPATRYIGFF
ncbi:hypothetical protein HMPREF1544_10219 [Mucor circinelloides 1006PhL]|uniref:Uncharacterized protein n=1 Tax=Mucor circinelloides f. circinelloides (strain 1006PhL) TaxID=1220926 RepID=S2IZ25_MUCC1|nr:hypothetical protein HMPREF1544_10219 [Mucor circinelloides 1006PhL]